jgi:uncharacterized lipoprotein YmbA
MILGAAMKLSSSSVTPRLLPLLVLPLLAGCSSLFEAQPDPTRLFLLSAPAEAVAAPRSEAPVAVGLLRIELPAYLRTPAIVLRPGGTEVRHAPAARWAEPLEQSIARVLKESLQAQPVVRAVVSYPAPYAQLPDFEISVRVLACEGLVGGAGGQVRFAARWEIRATAGGPGAAPVAAGTFESAPAEWADGDYAGLTAKLGESVAALGRELAAGLPK